ncbi:MAG: amidohydrolase family protein [Bacteroidia bacterium]|nr:amidohydrolase family protein [Bacteroidia bacterium]
MRNYILLLLYSIFLACSSGDQNDADVIYHNATVILMTGELEIAEAIAIKNSKILSTGAFNKILKYQGIKTEMKNLEGKTLLPGFIEGHSHLMMAAQMIDMVNLSSPPVSDITESQGLVDKLEQKRVDENIKNGEWLLGWGYDADLLEEKRHPTRFDLDEVFPDHSVFRGPGSWLIWLFFLIIRLMLTQIS